jgi:alpha-L-fucosidase
MTMPKAVGLAPTVLLVTAAVLFAARPAHAQAFDRQAYEQAIDKQIAKMDQGVRKGPYKADWKSLAAHNEAPEWFRDAKFGIYFHWGVYTVPAFGNEWYPKWMHTKKGRRSYYKHHVETYGEPDKFGYHDFVPRFKARHFDADEWAELFQKAGAQYAGPVCEHHDGYSMWDSALTPWNAGHTGPQRDITGELAKAIRKRGMKFVTTFHHERTREWYPRVEGWPTTSSDPKLQLLYMNIPAELFYKIFQAKLGEVIDKYQPDLIWFDGQLEAIKDPYHRKFLAHYFNQAKEWGRDVVVTCKGLDYPREIAVQDFEKGRANRLTEYVWLTDDTVSTGSWCYTKNLRIKPTREVLHSLIDIVSKNGCLLLNISPKSDGTIPDNQRQVLLGMGRWLKVNGEAIYNTRPWLAFGEGPTRLGKGGGFVRRVKYSAADVRYSRSKDGKVLYATVLGWPEGKSLTLTAVQVDGTGGGKVHLLGYDKPLTCRLNEKKQLVIDVPALAEKEPPCEHAYCLKLTGFKASLHPDAAIAPAPAPAAAARSKAPILSKDLTLDAAEAGLTGPNIRVEQKVAGEKNIGHWNNPKAQARWRVQIEQAGRYRITAVIAAQAPSKLAVDVAGRALTADVPNTGGWGEQRTIKVGEVKFDKPGVQELIVRPAEPTSWKAVNVWKLELTPVK